MKKRNNKVFVSRHKGAYEWFKNHHIELAKDCEYLTHINPEQIKGNIVVGTLPINLAVLAKEYWHLAMTIPAEMRGKELTVKDMEGFGCKIEKYIIKKGVDIKRVI